MRILLVLLLVQGMVPSLGEVAEAVVHYAVEGHLAHTEDDHGDLGDQGDEHGCGTTDHRCECCVSQAAAPAPAARVSLVPGLCGRALGFAPELATAHDPAPPYRPPIAS